jgi:D-3-phosphoglycerate dehydrogenase
MISMPQFKMMKKNALLVNVARGGIVSEDDLYEALKNKVIAGAAFDVFVDEPLKEGCKLLELDNLVMTPHLGASTVEAQEKVSVDIAENVIMYLRDNMISNAINAPRGQLDPTLASYLPLGERLGICVHQLNGMRPVDKIEVVFSGELAQKNTKMVTLSILIGVLKNIVGDSVNMINAESIAKGKNIKITESKNEDSPVYSNMVTVRVTSGKDAISVRGTVFAHVPRLIGIDNYCFEIPMDTDMLFARYHDKPGMIGSVGKILGENNINIGQMTVGRDTGTKMAIMLMGVDHEVPAELIKKISDATGFNETKYIDLVE